MGWQHTLYLYPTLFASVVSAGFAVYGRRLVQQRGVRPVLTAFTWLSVAVAVWTFLSVLKLAQTDPELKLLLYRLLHVGVVAIPPLLLLFALAYTDRQRWLRPPVVAGVFAPAVVFLVLLFLNPGDTVIASTQVSHDGVTVLRVEDGAVFLAFSVYSIVLVSAAAGFVSSEVTRLGRAYYREGGLLLAGLSVPVLVGLLSTAGVAPFTDDAVNFVPASAAVSVSLLGTAVFRYRLLDLPPIAYTTAMQKSPDSVFVLDTDRRIVHANERGSTLLSQRGSATGEQFTAVFPAVDPTTPETETVSLDSGTDTPAFVSVRSRRLERQERTVGWVVVCRDITELQQQKQTIELQNERLDEFASVVSHDLRNPLSVAALRLELIENEYESEETEALGEALDRMERIIEDTLTMARLGETVEETAAVELVQVASEAWAHAQTDDATLDIRVDDERTVRADRDRLLHIFENLFRNAVEHGSPDADTQTRRDAVEHDTGGATDDSLTVRVGTLDTTDETEPADETGDAATLSGFFVEDDGIGIPPAKREEVFDHGYTTTDEGTGFGLSIVADLVEAHGWVVSLTESADGGARFEIVTRPGD